MNPQSFRRPIPCGGERTTGKSTAAGLGSPLHGEASRPIVGVLMERIHDLRSLLSALGDAAGVFLFAAGFLFCLDLATDARNSSSRRVGAMVALAAIVAGMSFWILHT